VVAVCQILGSLFRLVGGGGVHPDILELFDLFDKLILKTSLPTTLKALRVIQEVHQPLSTFYQSNPSHEPKTLITFVTKHLGNMASMRPGVHLDEHMKSLLPLLDLTLTQYLP
jgi:hypothetical protein